MDATITPAGQAILRIERDELGVLLESLREALAVLETLRLHPGSPVQFGPDSGIDMDRDAEQIERLQDTLERAQEAEA